MAHPRRLLRRTWPRLLAVVFLTLPACRLSSVTLWPSAPPTENECEVDQVRNVAYFEPKPTVDPRHRLDLYLPKGRKDFPVVVLVHGGAWIAGDNRCCGLYSAVGEFLARQGIGAVLPNYRLSPFVRHPEHVKDVARAFAWTRAHIAEYGGRPDQLFLAGHSAGAHLVALLATDETYLRAVGLYTDDIKGVICVSGVYTIPPGDFGVNLGGDTPSAFRMDELFPVRGDGEETVTKVLGKGKRIHLNVFGPAFGNDSRERSAAAPINHLRAGLPPFQVFTAEKDLPTLSMMAEEFVQGLRGQGNEASLVSVPGRNHNSVLFRAITPDDPVARDMLQFVKSRTASLSP